MAKDLQEEKLGGIAGRVGYDTDSLIESWRDLAEHTNNMDRYDSALSNMSQLIQRREDWLRSQPAAQVERLMAAGMSRAQALATLNSTGESPVAETGIAGNAEMSDIERMNAISGIISDSFQLLSQTVQTGVQLGIAIPSIKTQVQQARIAKYQAEQMNITTSQARMQFDALQDVGSFVQAMQNFQTRSGVSIDPDLNKAILQMQGVNYEDMPDVFTLSRDRLQKAMENPYFYPALVKAHEQFSKSNYELGNSLLRDNALTELASLNNDKMHADIANSWQMFQNAVKDGKLTDEQIKNAQQAFKNALAQYGVIKETERLTRNQANTEDWVTQLTAEEFDFTAFALHPVEVKKLMGELTVQNYLEKGGYYKNVGTEKLISQENAVVLAQIAAMQAADYRSFYENAPDLIKLQYCLDQLNILPYNVSEVKIKIPGAENRHFELKNPYPFAGAHKFPSSLNK